MKSTPQEADLIGVQPVWDRTVRCFHWINVACVFLLMALGLVILNAGAFEVGPGGKIVLKTLHVYVGYVFCINLVWRLLWAFLGSRFARWRSILPFYRGFLGDLKAHVRGLVSGKKVVYLGHNPLGRLMITVLFTLLLIQMTTGLILAGTDLYKPPFGNAIAEWVTLGDGNRLAKLTPGSKEHVDQAAYDAMRAFRKPVVTLHEFSFYLLLVGAFLHIVGVIATEVREKQGLVSAMISGEKLLRDQAVDARETSIKES